jgi:hypothetical protein
MQKQSIGGLLVSAVLLAVGACGGTTSPVVTPVVMFSDDFTGASSGASWLELIYIHGFRGSSNRDTTAGNPRPSLGLYNYCLPIPFTDPKLDQCNPTSAGVITGTSLTLADAQSVTVTVDVLLPPITGGGATSAFVSINATTGRIDELGTPPWAIVRVSPDKAEETYAICDPAGSSCSSVIIPFSSDGRFHTYRFVLANDGSARWERDGVMQHSAKATLQGPFQVMLYAVAANVAGAKREYPVAHFDNVRVTKP